MSIPSPFDVPEAWDEFIIFGGGGKATIFGVSRVHVKTGIREDVVEIPGADGATVTKLSYAPAEVTVEIQLWESPQFAKLAAIIELHRPKRGGGKPDVVEAVHPQCSLHGIKSVYIFDIETPEYTAKDGYRATLRMKEWWPEYKPGSQKTERVTGQGGGAAVAPSITGLPAVYTPPSSSPPDP